MEKERRQALRVAIVEDQPLFRDMLARLIDSWPELSVAGSYATVAKAREGVPDARIDVALLDIELPDGNGLALGRELRRDAPGLGIVLLSAHDLMHVLLTLPEEERSGWSYLSKTSSTTAAVLVRAIRSSAEGGTVLDPELVRRSAPRVGSPLERLTPRQFEALQLVAEGLSNTAIAQRMNVSPHAIENLLNAAYAALDLRTDGRINSRVAAALLVIEHGVPNGRAVVS